MGDLASKLDRVAWPAAALAWAYLAFHSANDLGVDWPAIYRGPHDLLHGLAFYPTTDDPRPYYARGEPYYPYPPSAPIVLAPLGIFPEKTAGAIFVLASAGVFVFGLYRIARRTRFCGLILLAAALSLPVRDEIGLGNADMLAAGLVALSITIRPRVRVALLALAMAIKPTVWPILFLFGIDGALAAAAAATLALLGLVTIVESSRFFDNVIPFLAHGQVGVEAIRSSFTDLAVAAGLPRSSVSIPCGLMMIALLTYIVSRFPADRRLELAPLVVIATLTLSSYSYIVYVVYLIAVLPLLRPTDAQLPLLGVALYLIGVGDVWSTDSLPHAINTLLSFKVLAGMLLLIPIAVVPLRSGARAIESESAHRALGLSSRRHATLPRGSAR